MCEGSANGSCPYRWATHAIIVSNTHAPAEYKCPKAASKPVTNHLRMFAGFLFKHFPAPPQFMHRQFSSAQFRNENDG